jgi:hypothetical protein
MQATPICVAAFFFQLCLLRTFTDVLNQAKGYTDCDALLCIDVVMQNIWYIKIEKEQGKKPKQITHGNHHHGFDASSARS